MYHSASELCAIVGARVRAARLAKGMRQEDLAERSGVALGTLKRLERTGQGSLETVARLAIALAAEDGMLALFPEPEARSLDDILRRAKPKRQRGRRP